MTHGHRQLLLCWIGLILLAAIEFGCSWIQFNPSHRPVLLIPALTMVALVAIMFMRVRSGVEIVRVFAVAGLFWLTIMLGLGMMDAMTRAMYPVAS